MLDIVPSTENRPRSVMSLDLSPYLLSASPPSSDFSLHSLQLTPSYSPCSFFSRSASHSTTTAYVKRVCSTSCARSTPLKSIMSTNSIGRLDSLDSTESSRNGDSASVGSETSISSRNIRTGKRVSFADESGMPLTEVRMVLDNPTAPPLLSIRGLTDFDSEGRATRVVTGLDDTRPPLLARQPQPFQMAWFEYCLRTRLVAAENVVVSGFEVTCTMFVDNRPSSKRVFGRFTADTWHSFQDVTATFVQTRKPGYDSYQVQFQVPATADRTKPVQFAICYVADGVEHWDNNQGQNYAVDWNIDADEELAPRYTEDPNSDSSDLGDLVWCSHDDLDQAYY